MALRDTCSDTSKTTRPYERAEVMTPIPDHFQHPEPVPTGNTAGNKKDRPAG